MRCKALLNPIPFTEKKRKELVNWLVGLCKLQNQAHIEAAKSKLLFGDKESKDDKS